MVTLENGAKMATVVPYEGIVANYYVTFIDDGRSIAAEGYDTEVEAVAAATDFINGNSQPEKVGLERFYSED